MRAVFLMLLLVLPIVARAEAPEALIQRIKADPDRFLEEAAGLILGFGSDGVLDASGVARFVAVARARIRVRAERRLMLADLDADGAVTGEELSVLLRAEGAGPRGRLAVAHLRADADGDGTVSAAERMAAARGVAAREVAPVAADAAAVLALDVDGDGRINLAELRRALALVLPGA